jgi:hypothetical protein
MRSTSLKELTGWPLMASTMSASFSTCSTDAAGRGNAHMYEQAFSQQLWF